MGSENQDQGNFPFHLFSDIGVEEMKIIKSHLAMEHSLTEFLTASNKGKKSVSSMNLGFTQKVKMCSILGLFIEREDLQQYILDLNKLRNQVAHEHKYDHDLFQKLVQAGDDLLSEDDLAKGSKHFPEAKLIMSAVYYCGVINGVVQILENEV